MGIILIATLTLPDIITLIPFIRMHITLMDIIPMGTTPDIILMATTPMDITLIGPTITTAGDMGDEGMDMAAGGMVVTGDMVADMAAGDMAAVADIDRGLGFNVVHLSCQPTLA